LAAKLKLRVLFLIHKLGKDMRRADLQSVFAMRFSAPQVNPAAHITDADLRAVEGALKTAFPRSYVAFATAYGPLFTPNILQRLVVAREAGTPAPDGFDVQEFFPASEIINTHRLYVSGGMEDSLIPFAMDSGGGIFGFRREAKAERPDDAAVLFLDHIFCKVLQQADSFDAWLEAFLVLET
jgi:hypothetical protein